MSTSQTRPLLFAGFGLVLLLSLAVTVVGLVYKERVHDRMAVMASRYNTEIDLALSMRDLVRERSLSLHRMYMTRDVFDRQDEFHHFTSLASEFVELRRRFEGFGLDEREQALLGSIFTLIRRSQPLQVGLARRIMNDDLAGIREVLVNEDVPLEKEILALFDQLVLHERDEMHSALEREQAVSERTTLWAAVMGFVSLLLGAGIATFVTGRARTFERALHTEKELAEVTLHSVADGVISTDAAGRIRYLNPIAERLTGWPRAEAIGRQLGEVYRLTDPKTRTPVVHFALHGPVETAIMGLAPDAVLAGRHGVDYAVEDSIAPIRGESGVADGAVLVFRDVTQARAMTRELSWQATHDPLTGLVNRREFETLLGRLIASAREQGTEHVLLYLDLDQFKVVNDTCGHAAGDELLKQLVVLWQPLVRGSDTLARLGGDEFGVLLASCQAERAQQIADRLRAAAQDLRFAWDGQRFQIGVSIGMVMIDGGSEGPTEALAMADTACYLAKENGRNRVWIHRLDDKALAQRQGDMSWVSRITKAFDEDRFRLYFQRIDPAAGPRPGFVHCELLTRMLDENDQALQPMAFLRAAERYDLMGRIDRWVVRQAMQCIARFPGNAIFGVNLSSQSIGDDHFLEFVIQQLAESRVDAGQVCFEITETVAIANWARAQHFVKVLQDLGCQFALDDFGSGMSSFTYLKNLPVQFIKIEGVFVRDMLNEKLDYATVEAIIRIAQVLGVRTIAEFVENEETLAALRKMGADFVQGFAIHRPEPIERLGQADDQSRLERNRR